jgi:hypothetical protein
MVPSAWRHAGVVLLFKRTIHSIVSIEQDEERNSLSGKHKLAPE